MKLQSQFVSGHAGGKRIFRSESHGSDKKSANNSSVEARTRVRNSVADMLRQPGSMHESTSTSEAASAPHSLGKGIGGQDHGAKDMLTAEEVLIAGRKHEDEEVEARKGQGKKIFSGLTIYVNGNTHPVISDHKLKRQLAENGARVSMHLGRRQVTHVIVGKPAGTGTGTGGGLAGGKLEKEIRHVRGCGIKFVGVEWYVFTPLSFLALLLSGQTGYATAMYMGLG